MSLTIGSSSQPLNRLKALSKVTCLKTSRKAGLSANTSRLQRRQDTVRQSTCMYGNTPTADMRCLASLSLGRKTGTPAYVDRILDQRGSRAHRGISRISSDLIMTYEPLTYEPLTKSELFGIRCRALNIAANLCHVFSHSLITQ